MNGLAVRLIVTGALGYTLGCWMPFWWAVGLATAIGLWVDISAADPDKEQGA